MQAMTDLHCRAGWS